MTTDTVDHKPSKALNIGLWIVQVLLAAMFLMSGFMKLMTPVDALAQSLPWVTSVPPLLVKFIGFSEVAGALGLILPALTRIAPFLTPLAAAGLALIMLPAMGLHLMRGETPMIGMNLFLMALALFVAWGRFRKAPIASR